MDCLRHADQSAIHVAGRAAFFFISAMMRAASFAGDDSKCRAYFLRKLRGVFVTHLVRRGSNLATGSDE
jgi:hypothetical protein